MGCLSQVAARRQRVASGIRGACDYGDTGIRGARLDSNDEVRLAAALYLLTEHSGVHRAADRSRFPPRGPKPTAEWEGRSRCVMVGIRVRFFASIARAWESEADDWIILVLARQYQLSPLRSSPLPLMQRNTYCREYDDSASGH